MSARWGRAGSWPLERAAVRVSSPGGANGVSLALGHTGWHGPRWVPELALDSGAGPCSSGLCLLPTCHSREGSEAPALARPAPRAPHPSLSRGRTRMWVLLSDRPMPPPVLPARDTGTCGVWAALRPGPRSWPPHAPGPAARSLRPLLGPSRPLEVTSQLLWLGGFPGEGSRLLLSHTGTQGLSRCLCSRPSEHSRPLPSFPCCHHPWVHLSAAGVLQCT